MSREHQRLNLLSGKGIKKFPKDKLTIKTLHYGSIRPKNSSHELADAEVLSFEFETGTSEWWRIPNLPLYMEYSLTFDNPAYQELPTEPSTTSMNPQLLKDTEMSKVTVSSGGKIRVRRGISDVVNAGGVPRSKKMIRNAAGILIEVEEESEEKEEIEGGIEEVLEEEEEEEETSYISTEDVVATKEKVSESSSVETTETISSDEQTEPTSAEVSTNSTSEEEEEEEEETSEGRKELDKTEQTIDIDEISRSSNSEATSIENIPSHDQTEQTEGQEEEEVNETMSSTSEMSSTENEPPGELIETENLNQNLAERVEQIESVTNSISEEGDAGTTKKVSEQIDVTGYVSTSSTSEITTSNERTLPDERTELEKLNQSISSHGVTGVYLPPELGASAFFGGVEVEIDGLCVNKHDNSQHLYQTMCRKFSTPKQNRYYFAGDRYMKPHNDKTWKKDPGIQLGSEMMDTGSWHPSVAKNRGLRFGFEGVYLLGRPKCLTLSGMTGYPPLEMNHWTYLPPGTKISITLTRAFPIQRNIGFYYGEKEFYETAAVGEKEAGSDYPRPFPTNFNFKIIDLELLYEVYTFVGIRNELSSRRNSFIPPNVSYNFHSYFTSWSPLQGHQRHTSTTFTIYPKTQFMWLVILEQWKLFHQPNYNKSCELRCRFPANMTNLRLLIDEKPVFFQPGLTELTGDEAAYGSRGAQDFFSYLKDFSLYHRDFSTMFPKTSVGLPCDQAIPIPIQVLDKGSRLSLEMTFKEYSPENLYVVAVHVLEQKLTRKGPRHWRLRYTED